MSFSLFVLGCEKDATLSTDYEKVSLLESRENDGDELVVQGITDHLLAQRLGNDALCGQPFPTTQLSSISEENLTILYDNQELAVGFAWSIYNEALDSIAYRTFTFEYMLADTELSDTLRQSIKCLSEMTVTDICQLEHLTTSDQSQLLARGGKRIPCPGSFPDWLIHTIRNIKNWWTKPRGGGGGGGGGGKSNSGGFHLGWGPITGGSTYTYIIDWGAMPPGVSFNMDQYLASLTGSSAFRCRLWNCGVSGGAYLTPEVDNCTTGGRIDDEDNDSDYCSSILELYSCLERGDIHLGTVGIIEDLLGFDEDNPNAEINFLGQLAVEHLCSGEFEFTDFAQFHAAAAGNSGASVCLQGSSYMSYLGLMALYQPSIPLIETCDPGGDPAGVNALIMAMALRAAGADCDGDAREIQGCDGRGLEETVRDALASADPAACVEWDGSLPANVYDVIANGLAANGLNVYAAEQAVAQALNQEFDNLSDVVNCDGSSARDLARDAAWATCDGGSAAEIIISATQEDDWVILDWLEDDSRAKCLVNHIMENSLGFWCEISAPRFNGPSRIDLKFAEQNLFGAANAQTSSQYLSSSDPYVLIRLDEDYLENGCDIDVIRTIIHELVHAEMIAFIFDGSQDLLNFGDVYAMYADMTDTQHEAMAANYVTRIAEALQELFGDQYTYDQLVAFAWSGVSHFQNGDGTFEETAAWLSLSESERNEIVSTQQVIRDSCTSTLCE